MIETSSELFRGIFPLRNPDSNKNTYGRVTILGGSKLYSGAPLLSELAVSALLLGAGYSTLAIPSAIYDDYVAREPQILLKSMKSTHDGFLDYNEAELDEIMKTSSVIAFGMGAGTSENTMRIALYLLKNYDRVLILDADALNSLVGKVSLLKESRATLILTPHLGEFARLVGTPVNFLREHKERFAVDFASKTGSILLLKDYQSVITDGKETYRNHFGNTGLAKAGSGDMLDGILAGIFAWVKEGSDVKKAALGSYLLGKAAENIALRQPEFTILHKDILGEIPSLIREFLRNE